MPEWGEVLPYQRIVETLRARIESGELAPGAQIPSHADLSKQFDVSLTTAQRAIRSLKATGLVETKLGRGVFVREPGAVVVRSADYVKAPEGDEVPYDAKSTVRVASVRVSAEIARELGVADEETVVARHRTMTRDGKPVEIVTSYYPTQVAAGTELAEQKRLKGGSPAALGRLGIRPTRCVELVSTRMPTPDEARTLRIGPGIPVFRLLRTVYEGDRPVEVLDMVMEGGGTQLRYEMPITH